MIDSGNQTALWILAIALAIFVVYLLVVGLGVKRRQPAAPPAAEEVEDYNWLTTTDRAQLQDERDAALWRRWHDTMPRGNPFPQPSDERRRP